MTELERARDAGDLRRDIDVARLAEHLVASVGFGVSSALAEGRDPVAAALAAADLTLDGARRRHERVRISARVAADRTRA